MMSEYVLKSSSLQIHTGVESNYFYRHESPTKIQVCILKILNVFSGQEESNVKLAVCFCCISVPQSRNRIIHIL
jgi:hypothetical protein